MFLNHQYPSLPRMKMTRKPNPNPRPGEKAQLDSPRGLIVVTKNLQGRGSADLQRKAFIIQMIAEMTGPGSMLINRDSTDETYLKAVAQKHSLEYRSDSEGQQTMPKT